jgi:hypothetical protein
MRAGSNIGRTSAPRWPHAPRMNRGSRSDKLTAGNYQSASAFAARNGGCCRGISGGLRENCHSCVLWVLQVVGSNPAAPTIY